MAKPALGRGLGHLMNGVKPASAPEQPELSMDPAGASEGRAIGPGLGRLLEGSHREKAGSVSSAKQGPGQQPAAGISRGLFWTLLAADVLLLALAASVLLTTRSRPAPWTIALVVSAVGLGAWLSCYAVLSRGPGRPKE